MARQRFATIRDTLDEGANLRGNAYENLPQGEIQIVDMTSGIYTAPPRDKRPPGSAMVAKNARARNDWIGRRPGTYEPIEQPDGDVVLKVFTVFLDQDRRWLVRVTRNNIHATRSLSGWQQFTGTSIGYDRRISATQFSDYMYLASGVKKVIEVNFQTGTYAEVEGSPKARFITSFADRLVCGNVADPYSGWTGTRLQWSANGNSREWDTLEDESAGFVNLDSAPGDYGDEITGLFVVGQSLLILRERSVWLAERQPIASDPFRFVPLVIGVGCDLPHTGAIVPGGVMWADRRTNAVYFWRLGALPQRVNAQIKDQMLRDFGESEWVEAAYDPFEKEYHLGLNIPRLIVDRHGECVETEFMTKTWVYNLDTQAWCYDVGPIASTLGQVVGVDNLVYIDDLLGTIDEQVANVADASKPNPSGYIDDWGYDPEDIFEPSLYKGTDTGEVITYTWDSKHDFDCFRFEFLWQSQNMGHPVNQRTLSDLRFLGGSKERGYAIVEYSNNDWDWHQQKTLRPRALPHRERFGSSQIFAGNDLWWRVRSDAPGFRMYEFWVRMLDRARHRSG